MKTTIEFDLEPFAVPDCVNTKRDPRADMSSTTLPLKSLDSLTLDRLCTEFRNAVFRKAGKEQPPTAG